MRDRGQASVEWLALVLLVAATLGVGAAVVHPAAALRVALAERVDPLVAAYGAEIARAVRHNAPGLVYERGRHEVPVDPRLCRRPGCATEGATLFVHVARTAQATYIQYWEYFPDSVWNGIAGRHADDWESYQVRIEMSSHPPRVSARASAHHGYTGRRIGPDLNLDQVNPRLVPARLRGGWTAPTGWLRVAKGSHAGYVARAPLGRAVTPAREVQLVPLETARLPEDYAIVPPWRKRVYSDPESPAT